MHGLSRNLGPETLRPEVPHARHVLHEDQLSLQSSVLLITANLVRSYVTRLVNDDFFWGRSSSRDCMRVSCGLFRRPELGLLWRRKDR